MELGYVGEILLRRELLAREKLEELATSADERGVALLDAVRATRVVEELELVKALADEVGLPVLEKIDTDAVPEELIEKVPINFARQQHVLPISESEGVVTAALGNPLDIQALDDLRALLGVPVDGIAATFEAIDDAINRVYERKDEAQLGEHADEEEQDEIQDLLDATDEAPVIRFVNNLFYTSVRERASDIHIEPLDDKVVVRYRIDGRLVQRKEAPRGAHASIVSRVKIEAGLNIAEKRLPQDGRITKRIAGKVVDVRVSTIPTARGESVVMRLLDKENIQLDLVDLGFARRELDAWNHLIRRPNGILLVTGPTGSGKTTTLYASLNRINTPDQKILTAEDPVEYELRGINQLQVHSKIGLTFAQALRAFLRQDPDIIMVGEIRDKETADLAIQASLTGHLVLSTLHTNDAPGAITRLVDMEVQRFQISSTVLGVLAQRLVRRLCNNCKEPYPATMENLLELGIDAETMDETLAQLEAVAATTVLGRNSEPPAAEAAERSVDEELEDLTDELEAEPTMVRDISTLSGDPLSSIPDHAPMGRATTDSGRKIPTFYRAKGCDECSHTGYRGRIGIYELMLIDAPVRAAILRNSDSKTIGKTAQASGMRVLREDGARQVIAGVTSVEEVLAATQANEMEAAE